MSKTPIPPELKRAVMEKYGTKCLKCKVQCTPEWYGPTGLHFDHVIPESLGGKTKLKNLQPLCRDCNLAKGATYADYRKKKKKKKFVRMTREELICIDEEAALAIWRLPNSEAVRTRIFRSICEPPDPQDEDAETRAKLIRLMDLLDYEPEDWHLIDDDAVVLTA